MDNEKYELFDGFELFESVNENISKLRDMTAEQIGYAYYATILASLVLLRAGSAKIVRLLKDPQHKNLKKYSPNMSPLNFWGLVVHNPEDKDIKENLDKAVIKDLKKMNGRFISQSVKDLHYPLSTNPKDIDWDEILGLVHVYSLRVSAYDYKTRLIRGIIKDWNSMKVSDRSTAIQNTFFYLHQFDQHSILLPLLRNASTSTLLKANDDVPDVASEPTPEDEVLFYPNGQPKNSPLTAVNQDENQPDKIDQQPMTVIKTSLKGKKDNPLKLIKKDKDKPKPVKEAYDLLINKLEEDDAPAADPAITTSANIAPHPMRMLDGRLIRRVKRTFRRKNKLLSKKK